MSAGPVPVLAAEFASDDDDAPLRGRPLVDAARAAGATWVVVRAGADAGPLRASIRAAADAGLGVLLRLTDTRLLADLGDLVAPLGGERSVEQLRERLLVVVDSERGGKRTRLDAPWAPSAVDLGELRSGVVGLLRRFAPNAVRAMCAADDVLVPLDLYGVTRVPAVAGRLRTRGGRLWVTGVPRDRADALRSLPVHGLVLSLRH